MDSISALVVIAGPNGSGKSFYSSRVDGALIRDFGIKSFDFDLAYSDLYQMYISIMSPQLEINLEEKVKSTFHENIADSIDNKTSFSFQTNFHEADCDQWRSLYSAHAYDTHLFFLYLSSIEICMQRVDKRVAEGGHFVNKSVIEERYKLGLKNFDDYFHLYDYVTIIDASESNDFKKIFKIEKNTITFSDESIGKIIKNNNLIRLKKTIENLLNF